MQRWTSAVAVVALGLSAASLYLSVPRSISGAIEFGTKGSLSALRRGKLIPVAAQDRLINRQARAAGWVDSGEQIIDTAFAVIVRRFARARALGGKLPDEESFRPVERRLEAGLARSPISAAGWRWLAVARMTHKDSAAAATALRMSLYTGPHQRQLAASRLWLLMKTWDQFAKDEREIIYRQIRFTWRVAPNAILLLAMESRNPWPYRLALATRPRDLRKFQRALKRAKAKAAQETKSR
ncbi:MAG: hypothetical protein ACTSWM_01440 [Alphaproteobacteria bacterium]